MRFKIASLTLAMLARSCVASVAAACECKGQWESYSDASGNVVLKRACRSANELARSKYYNCLEVKNPSTERIFVTATGVDDAGQSHRWDDWPVDPGRKWDTSIDSRTATWRIGVTHKR